MTTNDKNDPCAVGTETTYKIIVSNHGTSAATNIKVWNSISPKMKFIRAKSYHFDGKKISYQHNRKKQIVFFKPIKILQPGQEIVYKIKCRSLENGSAINIVHLRYNEFDVEIINKESTFIYK